MAQQELIPGGQPPPEEEKNSKLDTARKAGQAARAGKAMGKKGAGAAGKGVAKGVLKKALLNPYVLTIIGIVTAVLIIFAGATIGISIGLGGDEAEGTQPPATTGNIVEIAKTQLFKPYVFGAQPRGNWATHPGPPEGIATYDCSSFTSWVWYWASGGKLTLPAQTTALYNCAQNGSCGTFVDRSELQPGDLILFSSGGIGGIHHVGLYIGAGPDHHGNMLQDGMIQAPTAHGSEPYVRINSISARDDYFQAFRPKVP